MRDIETLRKSRIVIYKTAPDDLVSKSESDEYPNGSVEGYLSTFGNVDSDGDVIRRGAYAKTIAQNAGRGWPLMVRHKVLGGGPLDVVGTIREAKEDDRGLWVRAGYAKDELSQTVRSKVADGHIRYFSVGFRPVDYARESRQIEGRYITEWTELALVEGTITPFPANTEAVITSAKSLQAEAALIDDPRAADLIAKLERLIETIGKTVGDALTCNNTDTDTDQTPDSVSPGSAQDADDTAGTPAESHAPLAVALMGIEADVADAEREIADLLG